MYVLPLVWEIQAGHSFVTEEGIEEGMVPDIIQIEPSQVTHLDRYLHCLQYIGEPKYCFHFVAMILV